MSFAQYIWYTAFGAPKITAGERFFIEEEKDPWGIRSDTVAVVTDCRDGWVKFRYVFDGERMSDEQVSRAALFAALWKR